MKNSGTNDVWTLNALFYKEAHRTEAHRTVRRGICFVLLIYCLAQFTSKGREKDFREYLTFELKLSSINAMKFESFDWDITNNKESYQSHVSGVWLSKRRSGRKIF